MKKEYVKPEISVIDADVQMIVTSEPGPTDIDSPEFTEQKWD